MTGGDITAKVIFLLGYNDMNGNTSDARFQTAAKNALNFIYSDLFYINNTEGFIELGGLSEDIDLPEIALTDVMPYGVAAFIAQAMGDTQNQQYFSNMYNLKRKRLAKQEGIRDVMPGV